MGAVLLQEDTKGQRHIISYASAKFSPTEARYHCNEQECLAVIWAIKRYRPYLEDSHFTLRTDSKALTWLRRMKDEKSKLARWAIFLDELCFTIEHCAGKNNQLADALSRVPAQIAETPEEPDLDRMLPPDRKGTEVPFENPRPVVNAVERRNSLMEDVSHFQQFDPLITREVIAEYHDNPLASHPGSDETLREIQRRYYWLGMREAIRRYVGSCHLCLCTKPIRTVREDALRPRAARSPWETIALDLMGPYPRSTTRKQFWLVVTDLFSRWVEAFPIASSEASKIISIMEREVFSRWGYPRQILSDNGRQFISHQWINVCQR